jgi:hypothetical protein
MPTGKKVARHGRPAPGWVHEADEAAEMLAIG